MPRPAITIERILRSTSKCRAHPDTHAEWMLSVTTQAGPMVSSGVCVYLCEACMVELETLRARSPIVPTRGKKEV
jgi:hypothetical protein